MLAVLGSVARDVEGAEASGVLAEFVGPEVGVGATLRDPVTVHVGEQIEFAEGRQKSADARSSVCGYCSAISLAVGSVWRRMRVELTTEITVLRIRSIAEVWPQAYGMGMESDPKDVFG